jgi:hypothetical protein
MLEILERTKRPDFIAHANQRRAEQSKKNGTRAKAYVKRRKAVDPGFKALLALRSRARVAMFGAKKVSTTAELLGVCREGLRVWLEIQFAPGMTWQNYGQWHIDRVKPCCSFDLLDPEQQRQCFHYTNLQPLWAADNFAKSGKH